MSKTQLTLFPILGSLRNDIPTSQILEVVTITSYIFWQMPEKAISSMQLGEKNLQSYLAEKIQADPLLDNFNITDYRHVNFMQLYESYRSFYQNLKEDKRAFAKLIIEGIYSGITMMDGQISGAFVDSTSVAGLMSEIAKQYPHDLVMDPASGLGRILYLLHPKRFIAKDVNSEVVLMSQLLFKMSERKGVFENEDSLKERSQSVAADLVILQPPYGLRIDGKLYQNQPYLLTDTVIPTSGGDSLWIQKALYQASEKGRVIVQVPPGWFHRSGYDYAVRKALIERNWIDAIIYLPGNLLEHTGIETNILILNKAKKTSTIRLINAKDLGTMTRLGKRTLENDIDTIVQSLVAPTFDETIVTEITLMEVIENEYDFSSNRYFIKELSIDLLSIKEELQTLKDVAQNCQSIQEEFSQLLLQLDKK